MSAGTADVERIEAPVTATAYLICAFASIGGILYGYDSGYISSVLGMNYFKQHFGGPVDVSVDKSGYNIETWQKSLTVSILSAGTFFGALLGGEVAERVGRRPTIMLSCLVFSVGVALQTASKVIGMLIAGRVIAGLGVGGVSAVVILYVSEISPKNVRGVLVSIYQWAITLGILLAACVGQGTKDKDNRSSYRIPIGIQFVWAGILAGGLFLLPESPRYYVKKGRMDEARSALMRCRGSKDPDSPFIKAELAEIQANYEYEIQIQSTSWLDCFKGGMKPSGNLYRVIVGTSLQAFQQWTGINFICKLCNPFNRRTAADSLPSLLRNHLLPAGRHHEPFHHYHRHRRCQRRQYTTLILHYREIRSSTHPDHWRNHHVLLRIHHRHRRHGRQQLQGGQQDLGRFRLHLRRRFRLHMGSCRLGRHR